MLNGRPRMDNLGLGKFWIEAIVNWSTIIDHSMDATCLMGTGRTAFNETVHFDHVNHAHSREASEQRHLYFTLPTPLPFKLRQFFKIISPLDLQISSV